MNKRSLSVLASLSLFAACGGSNSGSTGIVPAGAGSVDAGQVDAGAVDAGAVDAGSVDVASSGGKPDGGKSGGGKPGGGKPGGDKYACNINAAGYCIFTGAPHKTGLKMGTDDVVDREGKVLFAMNEAVAVNASAQVLKASGKPAADGDELVKSSQASLTEDEKAFHRVMAIMFPIRNALMYDIEGLTQSDWDALVAELAKRKIKDTTYTGGPTPKDNYYGRQGVFDLAKKPGGKDIHHPIMKFLEESGLYFLCHVTSDEFNQQLKEKHPAGHDACGQAGIDKKIGF